MSAEHGHILLIDDDPDMHLAVETILAREGHTVTCHQTGPDGLEAMRREPPALVLLDIMLTHPTEGLQLAAEMRRDARLEKIPIIIVSSIGQAVIEEMVREEFGGALFVDACLEKPFDPPALRTTVQRILKRETMGA
ncbi:MAG: response regulator [Phycisphaerae bacterium]|nr:response regulator [Phycisphaerae bacterium]